MTIMTRKKCLHTTMRTAILLFVGSVGQASASGEARFEGKTEDGKYLVSASPEVDELPIGEKHAWLVSVADADGKPFTPRQLAFFGGMPSHGHGMPSAPQVTREVEKGTYLVEGVEFNMHGEWEFVIGVVGPQGADKASFSIELSPPVRAPVGDTGWTPAQIGLMQSLRLPENGAHYHDSSNRFATHPSAIELGGRLFFDQGLSRDANLSCASCHNPDLKFTDGLKTSVGSKLLNRNSPSLLGVAHADWFYWDGRRDSLWAQALTPIETPGEMDGDRSAVVTHVLDDEHLKKLFLDLVGDDLNLTWAPEHAGPYGSNATKAAWQELTQPQRHTINRAFAAIGKAIAAYVATLEPAASRFDRYVDSVVSGSPNESLLSADERAGLALFLDPAKTQCLRCHNGPYFTNFGFQNIGTGFDSETGARDFGRMIGLRAARVDEFNCLGRYSDAARSNCEQHRYAADDHAADGAFKVPSLRNVAETGPYMHDGRFADLRAVVELYVDPPPIEVTGHDLPPLDLTDDELDDLIAFLGALTGGGGR